MMLRLTISNSKTSEVEYREIPIPSPALARDLVDEWERAMRHAAERKIESLTLTFKGDIEPITLIPENQYEVKWEYIP